MTDKRVIALTGGTELLSEAAIAKLCKLGAPLETVRLDIGPDPISLDYPERQRGPRMTRAEAKKQNRAMRRRT